MGREGKKEAARQRNVATAQKEESLRVFAAVSRVGFSLEQHTPLPGDGESFGGL